MPAGVDSRSTLLTWPARNPLTPWRHEFLIHMIVSRQALLFVPSSLGGFSNLEYIRIIINNAFSSIPRSSISELSEWTSWWNTLLFFWTSEWPCSISSVGITSGEKSDRKGQFLWLFLFLFLFLFILFSFIFFFFLPFFFLFSLLFSFLALSF